MFFQTCRHLRKGVQVVRDALHNFASFNVRVHTLFGMYPMGAPDEDRIVRRGSEQTPTRVRIDRSYWNACRQIETTPTAAVVCPP